MGGQQENQQVIVDNQNPRIKMNNMLFGVLTILLHLVYGLIFGFLIRPNFPKTSNDTPLAQTVIPWFLTFCYAMLVVPGFGLLLSYLKNMLWSGLGFTFLITALTLEMYFLTNALWGWAGIEVGNKQAGQPAFNTDARKYFFSLSYTAGAKFGNSFTYAFKAALANIVGFSAIIGRVGPLEALTLTFFGTIGFQLQRVILTNYSYDGSGTFTIFIYGGFLGLVASILLRFRENRNSDDGVEHHTARNFNYTADQFSSTLALLGSVIVWVFFPVLALDPTLMKGGQFTAYTGPLTMVFALSSSTITALFTSSALNNKIIIRDAIYGSIAGGVASATASTFVTNPVYGLLIGIVAGFVQVVGQNFIEKQRIKSGGDVVNTTSFILFGVQGIIGSGFAAGWNAIIQGRANGFTYTFGSFATETRIQVNHSYWQFLMGLMCIGFGIGVGVLVGILIMICSTHNSNTHFHDYAYWLDDDGIQYSVQQFPPIIVDQKIPITYQQIMNDTPQIEIIEGDHQIKNQHSYL